MVSPFIPLTKDQLIEKLGLAKFSPVTREEFLKRSMELIDKRIKIRLLDVLTDAELEAFRVVSEGNDERKIAEWLVKNVPQMREWLEEEVGWVSKKIIG